MKKRVLMIMLAAVMAFGLVACTGDAKDTKEKTKISRESEDEDDDEDDDKDSKKDKKKDKKDKQDKKDKKDKKDKDKEKDDNKDDDDSQAVDSGSADYWTVDDSVVGGDFTVDEEYVSTSHYNASKGELEVCDYDDNVIMTLYVPEGYVVTYASESGACFDLNNENQYFDAIAVDYRENLYLADYIKNGTVPGGDIKDYTVTMDEYEIDGVEFIIAYEEYVDRYGDDCNYNYILVPYKSGKDTEYLSICACWDRSANEMKSLAVEMLGLK